MSINIKVSYTESYSDFNAICHISGKSLKSLAKPTIFDPTYYTEF